jgi:hypothetical protein
MPTLIGLGGCSRICFTKHWMFAGWPVPPSTNFVSKTSCCPWTAPQYRCVCHCPWAKFRRTKGAVKLHLLLDHDGYLPTNAYISNGKKHDVTIARKVPLLPGSIVAMDRGYIDYALFENWTDSQIYFVI